jgi:hypothetical protein
MEDMLQSLYSSKNGNDTSRASAELVRIQSEHYRHGMGRVASRFSRKTSAVCTRL